MYKATPAHVATLLPLVLLFPADLQNYKINTAVAARYKRFALLQDTHAKLNYLEIHFHDILCTSPYYILRSQHYFKSLE
jgi:hypothetical protein